MAKVLTKYEIAVIEYDSTGYYYPKYKTIQKVISDSIEKAKAEAVKRTPYKHSFGSGWVQKAKIISSEDVIVD